MASASEGLSLYASLRIAAPFSRPSRQFGHRSVERLRLASGEVASMSDDPFMHSMGRNKFRRQAAVRSRTVELTREREPGAAILLYTQFSSRRPGTR
jgi:hypothetical protein